MNKRNKLKVVCERMIIYAYLEGNEIKRNRGKIQSIIDARKIFSDAQRYLTQNQVDQELVLTCMLSMFNSQASFSPA